MSQKSDDSYKENQTLRLAVSMFDSTQRRLLPLLPLPLLPYSNKVEQPRCRDGNEESVGRFKRSLRFRPGKGSAWLRVHSNLTFVETRTSVHTSCRVHERLREWEENFSPVGALDETGHSTLTFSVPTRGPSAIFRDRLRRDEQVGNGVIGRYEVGHYRGCGTRECIPVTVWVRPSWCRATLANKGRNQKDPKGPVPHTMASQPFSRVKSASLV